MVQSNIQQTEKEPDILLHIGFDMLGFISGMKKEKNDNRISIY